jgi:ubiquitin-protein ligase
MSDNHISKNDYSIELVDESNTHLIGRFSGPPDTQYSGRIFTIDIVLPDKYRFNPHICKFITNIWHSNVSTINGTICSEYWTH